MRDRYGNPRIAFFQPRGDVFVSLGVDEYALSALRAVCDVYGVPPSGVCSKSRRYEVAVPRHVWRMFVVMHPMIGQIAAAAITNCDGGTLQSSLRAAAALYDTDPYHRDAMRRVFVALFG